MIEGVTFTHGESELAFAVIVQAWKDAHLEGNGYESTRARCFLSGYPSLWKSSLYFWCSLCGLSAPYLMRISRQKWKPYLLKGKRGCKNK